MASAAHFARTVCTGRVCGASWSWVISLSPESFRGNCVAARMKILRSIHSLNPAIGGPMEAVKQSSSILISRGHRVEIICLDAPSDPWIRQYPVAVHALGPGRGSYGYAPRFDLATAREDFFNHFPSLRAKRFLLYLGRLHEKKGCDLLIESFVQTRPAGGAAGHLVIAGPPGHQDYLQRLKHLAADAETSITFCEMLTGNLKWGALSAADAFVLPSHQENFGIAVVEALACATPVLISNKVNIWREIVNDGSGFADEDDLTGVTRLLKRWIDVPATERDTMRANARACFERRFEINRAVDSLLRVLEERVAA